MLSSFTDSLTDRVYVDQVRSLYMNLTPAIVMWAVFAINSWLAYHNTPDAGLLAISIAGVLASSARIAVAAVYRERALTAALDRATARRLEIRFSIPFLAFSALLGAFAIHVFIWSPPKMHMVTICTIVGFCAGVATNCGLRPRLAIPSIVLAVGPPIIVSALKQDITYMGMAIIASGFVGGGVRSICVRFEVSKAEIGKRLASISMARRDVLTTLPNRLALKEYFDEHADLISPNSGIAVHYLDLDKFKPVNDRHGHAIGDALLLAVADRLRGAVRSGDIAARVGGDEFVVVQFGLDHASEAKLLARRIVSTIEQPFTIDDTSITVSVSIGTTISHDWSNGLEALLKDADARLYETKQKRARSGAFALSA